MLRSMTAFARTEHHHAQATITCELRSFNNRYFECIIRLPEALSSFDPIIREKLRAGINRGKVECVLSYQIQHTALHLAINTDLTNALHHAYNKIAAEFPTVAPVNFIDILHWPGILPPPQIPMENIQKMLGIVMDEALHQLIATQQKEGKALTHFCLQRIQNMHIEIEKIQERVPIVLAQQREKIKNRLQEILPELDPLRIEQEMLLFIQKMDISEEIDRIQTHLIETKQILTQGGTVGRRLDFLMQELGRETNTLGAKANDAALTHHAIELKVLIEQIREQVQNIE